MIEIRQINQNEWQLLRQVRLAAVADSPQAFADTLEKTQQMPQSLWQRRALSGSEGKDSYCAVALDGSNPIGIAVGLTDADEPKRTFLVSMWVAAQYRGTSIAPSLLQRVLSWATSIAAEIIMAGVKPGNDRAARFYERNGFRVYFKEIPPHPATSDCNLLLFKELH